MTKPKVKAEAVNSAQLDELDQAISDVPSGPSVGELEERAAEAELKAEGLLRENAELKATMQDLANRMKALEKQAKAKPAARNDDEDLLPGETPLFNEDEPHGTVVGDERIAYVQNGYQFGRDREYIGREQHRGVPRAFNPRLVGWVKPRPGMQAVDPFEGLRDKNG